MKWGIYMLEKIIIIALIAFSVFNHHRLSERIIELQDEVDASQYANYDLRDRLADYGDALDSANKNIRNAKWSAWGTYDDMGYALDSLETVEP